MSTLEMWSLRWIEGKEIFKRCKPDPKTRDQSLHGTKWISGNLLCQLPHGKPKLWSESKGRDWWCQHLGIGSRRTCTDGLVPCHAIPFRNPRNYEWWCAAMNAGKEEDEKILFVISSKIGWKDGIAQHERRNGRTLFERRLSAVRKRNEILQLLMLKPTFALFDEIDSGLDIDALRSYLKGLMQCEVWRFGAMITHYQRLLNYITPGRRSRWWKAVSCFQWTGIGARLEREGYAQLRRRTGYLIKKNYNLMTSDLMLLIKSNR